MQAVKRGTLTFNPKKWKDISKEAKDLVSQMIVKSPSGRITAQDALDHKWFKEVLDDNFEETKLSGALKRLKKFEAKQKMQQAALGYIIFQLSTKENTEELDEAFRKLDTNHDGKLDLEELLEGCNEVFPEMDEDEIRELFDKADTDGSGAIDYTEWITATINKSEILTEENLKNAFEAFDDDGDGQITTKELKQFLGQGRDINEEVWEQIIAEADEDKNGTIDFSEFKNMMKRFIED